MAQLAIREFVANAVRMQGNNILSGTTWGNGGAQLVVWRQRPKVEKLGMSTVEVIVGRMHYRETRKTVPRGAGEKQRAYTVECLIYATHSDEQVGGDDFDTVVERVSRALSSVGVPAANVVDPSGRDPACIVLVCGERLDMELLDPILTAGQGRVRFYAIVTCEVTEIIYPA